MTTTETPFLHQVRLARCEALAAQLAVLRVKLPFARKEDQEVYKSACTALEADLLQAAGTPEQRALEAAVSEAEGQLTDALREDATRMSMGSAADLEFARQKLRKLELQGKPRAPSAPSDGCTSEYTSEDEDTLARLRSLATSLHTDPELKNRSGTQVLAKFMEVMSLLGVL